MERLLQSRGPVSNWTILILLSTIFAGILAWIGVPAALLLGPLIAGVIVASSGAAAPSIPRIAFGLAQSVLGCMIAQSIPHLISADVFGSWPLFLLGVFAVIIVSAGLSWMLAASRIFPGTTAIWGLSPGAATAMTLLAESYGADPQLVAFMQYTRVVGVAAIASIISKVVGVSGGTPVHTVDWFGPVSWLPFAETLILVAAGPIIARRMHLRAGALFIPLVAAVLLQRHGIMTVELPHWFLAVAYAFIGWRIGLRFNRQLLRHAARMLPVIVISSLALIAACGCLAAVFVKFAGIDPLTAYLATSPGGVDSVAIIAASSNVDTHFVMTMQMARFVVVLLIGPPLAGFIARRVVGPRPS